MKKIYIIATVLALVTGIAAFSYAKSLEAAAKPQEIPTTTVVITTVAIGEGVFIAQDMVQLKTVPSEFVAAGAATTLGDVVGKVNKYKCMANQQVTLDQLGSAEDASITAGGRLSYSLKPGMRAMTISTSEITGVGGYVNAGDHVDILCTLNMPGLDEKGENIVIPTSTMLLENVLVLETGVITSHLTAEDGSTSTEMYTSLTIEVTPPDAVKIRYAVAFGELSFLLRSVDDAQMVKPADYVLTATPAPVQSPTQSPAPGGN